MQKSEKEFKIYKTTRFAVTFLEAMSYGKCVIYSDIPENVEAAEGVGISFRNKDIDDLAEKMRFALENPEYCQELGAKARERVGSKA